MSPNKIFSSEFEIILFALGTLQPKLQLPKKEEVLNWIKLGNLICKCPLSLGRLSICFANILFCFVSVENFSVWCSPICSFFTFVSLIWRDISRKTLLKSMPKSMLAMFSSRGFMLSGLNIQIFNPFWVCVWVGVCGVRNGSTFILLPVAIQFSQHHLAFLMVFFVIYKLYLIRG